MLDKEEKIIIGAKAIRDPVLQYEEYQEEYNKLRAAEQLETRNMLRVVERISPDAILANLDDVLPTASEIDRKIDLSSIPLERDSEFIRDNPQALRYVIECPSDQLADIAQKFLEDTIQQHGGDVQKKNPILAVNNTYLDTSIHHESMELSCTVMTKTGYPCTVSFISPMERYLKHEIATLDQEWLDLYDKGLDLDSPELTALDEKIEAYQKQMAALELPKDIERIPNVTMHSIEAAREQCCLVSIESHERVDGHDGFVAEVKDADGKIVAELDEQRDGEKVNIDYTMGVWDPEMHAMYSCCACITGDGDELKQTGFSSVERAGRVVSYDPTTDKFEETFDDRVLV